MLITTKTADDFSTDACKSLHRPNDANDLHDKRRPQRLTQHFTNRDELDDDIALYLAFQQHVMWWVWTFVRGARMQIQFHNKRGRYPLAVCFCYLWIWLAFYGASESHKVCGIDQWRRFEQSQALFSCFWEPSHITLVISSSQLHIIPAIICAPYLFVLGLPLRRQIRASN